MLSDKYVYVQNVGDKTYCEQIEKRVKSMLDYRNMHTFCNTSEIFCNECLQLSFNYHHAFSVIVEM